jgi:hypothetical protein
MASKAISIRRRGIARFARRKLDRRFAFLGSIGYLTSRCNVCRRRKGLYFFFSNRPGVFGLFLFRVVIYRDTGFPWARASVHSRVTISRGMSRYLVGLFLSVRLGFLFVAFAPFVIRQTEERGNRLAHTGRFPLFFNLRLAFNRETGKRNRFQPGVRNRLT